MFSKRSLFAIVGLLAALTATPARTDAPSCHFLTYGELMQWGLSGDHAAEWEQQCQVCGVSKLPKKLRVAFEREWKRNNPAHPVYQMRTATADDASSVRQRQCEVSRRQESAYQQMLDDLHDRNDVQERLVEWQLQEALIELEYWMQKNCS